MTCNTPPVCLFLCKRYFPRSLVTIGEFNKKNDLTLTLFQIYYDGFPIYARTRLDGYLTKKL